MCYLFNKSFASPLAFGGAICYNGCMNKEEVKLNFEPAGPVAITRCERYDAGEIEKVIKAQLESLGISPGFFENKRVVVKPNLIMSTSPERMATTHPAVVEAVLKVINAARPASVTVAESPGGPHQPPLLRAAYNASGIAAVANRCGAALSFDTSTATISLPDGKLSKTFEILAPAAEADVIVNVCKLKTHALTQMTAAAKNLFGLIPGTDKVAMHARFPHPVDFSRYLVDLACAVASVCPMLCIVDAVVGMEGNGPTGGTPKPFGCIISGRNPFAVDTLCEYLLRLEGEVVTTADARLRGLCPGGIDGLRIVGDEPASVFRPEQVKHAETKPLNPLTHLPGFLRPKPVVELATCTGCGACAESCPAKAIAIENRKARISYKKCIRCFCCQEMCRFCAVKIHKNFLLRLVK